MSGKHGGINPWDLKEAGINPDDVKDFSVSINPVPLPESIRRVIHSSALYRYPDSQSRALVEAVSRKYGPSIDEILAVNGTSQGIFLIAGAFISPGDSVIIVGPTYSEYRDASSVHGARIVEYRSDEKNKFRPDCRDIAEAVKRENAKILWTCSPNNPTGTWFDDEQIDYLAEVCRKQGCRMVLDEAYRCFAPEGLISDRFVDGVIHLRSMTKDFCIPGLRLGWLRADTDVVERLMKRQPDWSVSAPAQDAGEACLNHLPYFQKSWLETRRQTDRMARGLSGLGLTVFPTAANFLLVRIGDDAAVKRLSSRLWKRLIQVRDCASFGLEGCIRIGARTPEDIDFLLESIKEDLS
ncbi:MAG: histidinol-phosphate transaminase [Spirochaetaceae bacterium]|nr:histidinol-phosphate transaminase [Spirochaetaceae bacterium]MDT8298313.1 histidinol-phosphate transaminase [Spirochaetaceae bacterium]